MTDSQLAELEQTLATSLSSTTIEWALNFRVCDMIQANPSLTSSLMRTLTSKIRKDSPVPVLLALSLLEIVAKNVGLDACRFIDESLTEALMALVKKREGWKYSLGRNLHKSFGTAASSYGIDQAQRDLWMQASLKVREMLQLWTDAFLLQEGQLRPIFSAYKLLRREGYTFPEKKQGASADICLMHGAEESPAYLAAGGGVSPAAPSAAEEQSVQAVGEGAPAVSPVPAAASPTAPPPERRQIGSLEVEATRDMCRELREMRGDPAADSRRLAELHLRACAARDEATRQVQQQMESAQLEESQLEAIMLLLDDLNEVLPDEDERQGAGSEAPTVAPQAAPQADLLGLGDEGTAGEAEEGAADSAAPLPPPPEEAPPDREQQELYDLILARYLQERENEAFQVNEEEDAALALRLSLEEAENGNIHHAYAQPAMISCAQCGAVNQLNAPSAGGSELFVCYACGLTQGVPALPSRARRSQPQARPMPARAAPEVRPTRHAPPPRVICAGGTSELLIGGAGGANSSAEPPNSGGYVPPALSATASGKAQSFEGGMGKEALLGAPPKSSKAWKLSVPSWASTGGSSSAAVKTLGEGAPESEYMAMGDGEEGAALCGGGAPPSKSSASAGLVSGFLPWRSGKKKDDENRSPLLERVQVDEEWELIRPQDQRPYWHNSVTQASQWQPPDVVSSNMTSSLLG